MTHSRTLPLRALLAGAFAVSLATFCPPDARAEVSFRFSSGVPGHDLRKPSHGLHYRTRGSHGHHGRHRRPQYSHGVPFLPRQHPGSGAGVQRHHGAGGHRALPLRCRPATLRRPGRPGHRTHERVVVCTDSFGRPYIRNQARF